MTRLKKTRTAVTGALLAALLAGCTADVAATAAGGGGTSTVSAEEVAAVTGMTVADALAQNLTPEEVDTTYDESDVVDIALSGDSATADSDAVTVDGGTVTITASGTYRLSAASTGRSSSTARTTAWSS